jgi:hypothetical protein
MELVRADIKTIAYIESETQFNRAKLIGVWEILLNRLVRRPGRLQSFAEAVEAKQPAQAITLGLQDIPTGDVVGSVGRSRDYTRRFRPRSSAGPEKERWRMIYTLAVTGLGFPPVELYKIGQVYYVKDGHHRISVASHLAWPTIQACVIELRWLKETEHRNDDQK